MTPDIDANGDEAPSPLVLHSITVRRFRSLFDVGPLPIQEALTVLTGENDGGKTTCLDAVAFLLTNQAFDAGDRSHWADDDEAIEVEGVFYALDDPEHFDPVSIKACQEPGATRICHVRVRAHTHFGAQWATTPLHQLKELMKAVGIPLPGGSAKAPFTDAVADWLIDRPKEEWEDCWSPATRPLLDRLPRLTRFSAAEAQSPTRVLQKVVAREVDQLIAQTSYSEPLKELGQQLDLDIASGLGRIMEKIRQHSPDLEDVNISASFDFSKPASHVQIEVCRQGEWSDLDKGGEGRRRRVTLAVHEATAFSMAGEAPCRTEVIVYDEPDTHLDFTAQRTLFDVLHRQARLGHVQVLIATHSKNFIDMVPMGSILHFRLGGDQRTRVETLSTPGHEAELAFQAAICESLGLRNSMLLDERCSIVVEGDTEERAILLLFPLVTGRTLVAAGVHLMNTRGNGQIRAFVETLKLQLKRDIVLLADTEALDERDERKRESWLGQLELPAGAGSHFIGTKEFEDAFADELWLHALAANFPPAEGEPAWTCDDMAGFRKQGKFSAALHSEVCRRCKDRSIGKPDLGLALAQACTSADDVPLALHDCFAAACAITGRGSR